MFCKNAVNNVYTYSGSFISFPHISKMGAGLKMGIVSGAPSPTEPGADRVLLLPDTPLGLITKRVTQLGDPTW